jgi:small conductance mechanosensitive channel
VETVFDQLVLFATSYGLRIIGALLILLVGRVAAGFCRRLVSRLLQKGEVDPSIVSFTGSLIYFLILAFAVLAALGKFGVETASFIAVLGAAAFAVGFALQGSLSNFAAGVLILVLRPFRVGDFVDAAGVVGTVKAVHLFTTVLATPDNIQILVPNSKIYGDVIKNMTANPTRRIDLVVGIGYTSSIEEAERLLKKIISEEGRVLSEPEPFIAVSELADSSVNFVVRPWVNRADYWNVRCDLTRKIKDTFDANGIEIPFPQRTVHMVSEKAAS